ncbi:hypothetical protein BaRGS_00003974, partial [Batillaria attramentaria]
DGSWTYTQVTLSVTSVRVAGGDGNTRRTTGGRRHANRRSGSDTGGRKRHDLPFPAEGSAHPAPAVLTTLCLLANFEGVY